MKRVAAWMAAASLSLPWLASATVPTTDCEQLNADIARVEQARRKAAEDNDNAWKAVVPFVVPFVVLARKASAKSAQGEADKRLAELKAQSQRCTVTGDAQ